MTWAELRRRAEEELRAAGLDQPGVEVAWMLEEVSGLDAAEQVTEARSPATRRAAGALEVLVARRLAGEPLQYVLGSWSFCGIDLLVDRRVLIPRPETEVVAQVAIDEVAATGERVGPSDAWSGDSTTYAVADLGTGSGALALALAFSLPDARVWATELDRDALAIARANIAGAGTPAARVRVVEGSWFDALPDELRGNLRLVVSNPPYVAEHEVGDLPAVVTDWEPRRALVSGPTGREALDAIVRDAPEWLEPTGVLVLELAPHQAAGMAELARSVGFASVEVRPDLTGRDRVLVARRAVG
jgi:release factor glutamine methyltransferase